MTEFHSTRWGAIFLILFAGSVGAAQLGKLPGALPEIRADLDIGLVTAGWVISTFVLIGAVCSVAAGMTGDRFGHRRILICGIGLIAIGSFAGAMAPVTIIGAIVQQNAEALAAIALLQSVREGAPVMYGAFTSNVDMKTGAPAFGTPEFVRAMQISGQMARHYNLPFRASNANAANALDAQAVWESAFSLQGSCSGGANLIYHAAGWMEGGLSASFEKFVIDCEMLQQKHH